VRKKNKLVGKASFRADRGAVGKDNTTQDSWFEKIFEKPKHVTQALGQYCDDGVRGETGGRKGLQCRSTFTCETGKGPRQAFQ